MILFRRIRVIPVGLCHRCRLLLSGFPCQSSSTLRRYRRFSMLHCFLFFIRKHGFPIFRINRSHICAVNRIRLIRQISLSRWLFLCVLPFYRRLLLHIRFTRLCRFTRNLCSRYICVFRYCRSRPHEPLQNRCSVSDNCCVSKYTLRRRFLRHTSGMKLEIQISRLTCLIISSLRDNRISITGCVRICQFLR